MAVTVFYPDCPCCNESGSGSGSTECPCNFPEFGTLFLTITGFDTGAPPGCLIPTGCSCLSGTYPLAPASLNQCFWSLENGPILCNPGGGHLTVFLWLREDGLTYFLEFWLTPPGGGSPVGLYVGDSGELGVGGCTFPDGLCFVAGVCDACCGHFKITITE